MSNAFKITIALLGLVLFWIGTIYFRRGPIEEDLTAHVREALSRPEFSAVSVSFKAREGMLTGTVDSAAQKEEAGKLAREYWGVRSITNRIEVAAPQATAPAEEPAAAAPVAEAAAAPAEVPPPYLKGAFKEGRFVLSGIIPGEEFRDRLIPMAEAAFGAGNVVDDLQIVPGTKWPPSFDSAWSYFLKLGEVGDAGFALQDDMFLLSGKVADEALRDKYGADASAALAPLQVRNDLTVSLKDSGKAQLQQRLNDFFSLNTVEFHTGSARLTEASMAILDAAARMLSEAPDAEIEIQGHTDNVGRPEGNLALSAKRAKSVQSYLIMKGIAEERLTAAGYGDTRPIDDNSTAAGRQRNRRVAFEIK